MLGSVKLVVMAFDTSTFLLPLPRDDDLPKRLGRLFLGLTLFGVGIGMMVRAELGLPPWGAFHQGVSDRTGLSFGTVAILTGLAVLIAWIPLKERLGLGTVSNAMWVGVVVDMFLNAVPNVEALPGRVGLMVGGVVTVAIGSGFYIGAGLGPGPRDGIMIGLARKGLSIRMARTVVEATALSVGVLLGGQAGIGTVVFLVGIGPLVQIFLRLLSFERTDYSTAPVKKSTITE